MSSCRRKFLFIRFLAPVQRLFCDLHGHLVQRVGYSLQFERLKTARCTSKVCFALRRFCSASCGFSGVHEIFANHVHGQSWLGDFLLARTNPAREVALSGCCTPAAFGRCIRRSPQISVVFLFYFSAWWMLEVGSDSSRCILSWRLTTADAIQTVTCGSCGPGRDFLTDLCFLVFPS